MKGWPPKSAAVALEVVLADGNVLRWQGEEAEFMLRAARLKLAEEDCTPPAPEACVPLARRVTEGVCQFCEGPEGQWLAHERPPLNLQLADVLPDAAVRGPKLAQPGRDGYGNTITARGERLGYRLVVEVVKDEGEGGVEGD